ncbi:lysine--tRNA ligase [Candidatus Babeliales bacterium]|nr:lysine--tRNA ligase [Candidatus Babeliales bacterium]
MSNKEHSEELNENEIRLSKLEEMRKVGIEPWASYKPVKNTCKNVLEEFKEESEKEYIVAGRILTVREHGKIVFANIMDRTSKLQIYIRKDALGEENFDNFKKFFDLGDIIWVKGTSFRTKMGEVTIKVQELSLLSKCLHPLPEKYHGLADVEQRYRQRYLDLISNEDSAEKFKKRSKIVKSIRHFLEDKDFLEVETPMLHPIPGGATAKPFVTHHNAYDMDLFLRIAPELYLKRLIVGGFGRVFEINRNFRNEGVSTKHNPEFTMLEFYMAHGDYNIGMDLTEELLSDVISKACETNKLEYKDNTLDFTRPFKRLTVFDSLKEFGGFSEEELDVDLIDSTLKKNHITLLQKSPSYGMKLWTLFEEAVEEKLISPVFITQHPIEVSPLAKRDDVNPFAVARFELFAAGMELANGFSELNDPFDQSDRFHQQVAASKLGYDEAHKFDGDYINALEYGLPPTVGVGLGVDRLTMLLTNTSSIKDVILFPTMKLRQES